MSRKLLLLLALTMLCTTVYASVASAHAGPPPRCDIRPNDPRCRP